MAVSMSTIATSGRTKPETPYRKGNVRVLECCGKELRVALFECLTAERDAPHDVGESPVLVKMGGVVFGIPMVPRRFLLDQDLADACVVGTRRG